MLELENKIREALPRLQEVDHFFGVRINKEHPIKLNDVLEWSSLKTTNFFIEDCKAYFAINYGNKNEQQFYWNLSSVFLADQSECLINFLNEL